MKTITDLKKTLIFKSIGLRYTEDSHIKSLLSPAPLSLWVLFREVKKDGTGYPI